MLSMQPDNFAFLFPGQGSQQIGMLADLDHPILDQTFDEAKTILGYDLWQIAQHGPIDLLNQTEHTQPILLTASVALWRMWQQYNHPLPTWLAGHSLGEYSALVCAQAMTLSDALPLVKKRGQLMQTAVPQGIGAMAAVIGLSNDDVMLLCKQASTSESCMVTPANYNAPGQVVVAGHTDAVKHVMLLAKTKNAKLVKQLPMSIPSHCPMMLPAAQALSDYLKLVPIQSPQIPVLHNADLKTHQQPQAIRDALVKQLYTPVRWTETIQYLLSQNIDTFFECGPGKVLSGLNKRIDKQLNNTPLSTKANLPNASFDKQS
jgi:[acyl-carrier-protein] S-malonyltransferase